VLNALREKGLEKDTLVIFSADNGAESYAYERIRNFEHFSSGPFRGVKRDLWEGGHHVPMVIRWPGHVPAGRAAGGLMSQIDIYATIAAAVGATIAPRAAEDSVNQLDFWRGKSTSKRTALVHNTNPKNYALRSGNWLLVDAPSGGVSKVPAWYDEQFGYAKNPSKGELYDLKSDPAQKQNLYGANPETVAALQAELRRIRESGDNVPTQ
jgi:arylsulfatase A